MNTMHESRADTAAPAASRILVWDAPVRLFHGLVIVCFAGAWLSADSERWRALHVTLGWSLAGLVVFRLVWGLFGSRWARFGSFVSGPRALGRYLRSLLQGRPEHHTGHNPAGALAIVALLGLALGVAGTGWAVYADVGGRGLEEAHELLADAMLAVVGVHVLGVLLGSWLHRENLIASMLSGRKSGAPQDAIRSARLGIAALMLAAVLGFWYWQWSAAPAVTGAPGVVRSGDDD